MRLRSYEDELPTLNLTSMIDVLFLLIIFFMLVTRFADMERDIAVQVPRVSDNRALSPGPARRTVHVYRDGRIALDREFVTVEQLMSALAAANRHSRNLGVVVRGDGRGAFQNVATVLNACRQCGIKDMGISVQLTNEVADTGTGVRR
jgi:biopolymer transport protein ExbD